MRCLWVPWPALNYEYKTLIKLYNFSEPCQSYQQGHQQIA
jgi:hypothetical protein